MLEHVGEQLAEALNEVIATQTDPILQMKAAVQGTFHFFARNPGKARILLIETSGLGGRLERLRSGIIQSHERSVEESLRSLVDRLPPLDPQISSYCWVGAVHEAVRRWLEADSSKRLGVEEIAEGVASYNLRAVGASGL